LVLGTKEDCYVSILAVLILAMILSVFCPLTAAEALFVYVLVLILQELAFECTYVHCSTAL